MKCPDCNGSGKVQLLTSAKECATCGGNGEVIADADMQTVLAAAKVNGGVWHGPTFAVDNTSVHDGGYQRIDPPSRPDAIFAPQVGGIGKSPDVTVALGVTGADEAIKQLDGVMNAMEAVAIRLGNDARQPIDVTGKPTPPEIIKGVYGQTHLDINNAPRGTLVFLNGDEVKYVKESDSVGGWVRVMDYLLGYPMVVGDHIKESILFGKVEVIKRRDDSDLDEIIDAILRD